MRNALDLILKVNINSDVCIEAKKKSADQVRCICGALIARLVPGGVELKCRRCKRTQVVPFSPGPSTWEKGAARI